DVLARRIGPVEEPGVYDVEESAGAAGLDLALRAQRRGLLVSHGVAAAVAASPVNHGNALVLVVNRFGQVGADHGLVVWMGHDHKNVGLEALVGRGTRRRLGALSVVGGPLSVVVDDGIGH